MAHHLKLIANALLLAVPCIEVWEHFSSSAKLPLALGLGFAAAVALVLLASESDA